MTDVLPRAWEWVARRRLLTGWLIALLCLAGFSGGVVIGAREPPPAIVEAATPARAQPQIVQGRVIGRRPGAIVVRTAAGERIAVRITERTRYRLRGNPTDESAAQRGARVSVLTRTGGSGGLVARVVVVRRDAARASPSLTPGPSPVVTGEGSTGQP